MDLSVLFASSEVVPFNHQIVISPSGDWNDFGYKIRCEFKVDVGQKIQPMSSTMLIGFLSPKPIHKDKNGLFHPRSVEGEFHQISSVAELLHRSQSNFLYKEDAPLFFTLQPSIQDYRDIVRNLGADNALAFFKAVNDLVVHKDQKSLDWYDDAISSDVFNFGFMRNSEPFYAFHNAEMVLDGLDHEEFDRVSESLDLSFSLAGFPNRHNIKLRFSSQGIIPGRINVLIGKNGLGKSQALKQFCRAALGIVDTDIQLIGNDSPKGRPMISRVLAIATPGETTNTFPPERIKDQKLHYRRLSLTRNSRLRNSRSVGDTLIQLVRSEQFIGTISRWNLFLKALERVIPIDSIVIRLKNKKIISLGEIGAGINEQNILSRWANISSNADPLIRQNNHFYPLSSGQLTFFKFALLCCLHIENGSFVLMDEPETHMHPNMISEFVELLDFILEKTGSHAILATHSAYFVREVSREHVHVFQHGANGEIEVIQPRLQTFGSPVDAISEFVFNENIASRLTNKIYEKVKGKKFSEVDALLSNKLSLAALMDLQRRMGEG